jgi:O-antigen/teichoic acid export membrane protein
LQSGRALAREPLFANAGYLMTTEALSSLFGFFYWGLAARFYHPGEVGTATAVLSAAALVSGLAGLGIGNGIIRFLPEAHGAAQLVNSACTLVVLTGLVVGGAFLTGLSIWSPSLVLLQHSATAAIGFLLFGIVLTLNATIQSVFVAHRLALYVFIHSLIIHLVRLPLVAMLAGLQTAGLVLSTGLGFCLALALSLVVLLPKLDAGYRLRPQLSFRVLFVLLPFSMGNHVSGLLAQSSRMLLPLVILEKLGPVASGHAYIAWVLGSFLATPGIALAGSAFAEGANAPHNSALILTRAAIAGLLLTSLIAFLVWTGAHWLLLTFGHTYAEASAGLLRWLAAAAPLTLVSQLYFTQLRIQKRLRSLMLGSGALAAVTLGISLWLMPRFGIAATGMGWAIGNGLVVTAGLISTRHWMMSKLRTALAHPGSKGR